jgi:hypothetical protein
MLSDTMSESIHEYVVQRLTEWKGRWDEVSDGSGVPLRTIEKVARREYKSHRLSTIDPLHSFFRQRERRRKAV